MAITADIRGSGNNTVSAGQRRILLADVRLAYAMAHGVLLDYERVWHQRKPNIRGKRQQKWLDNPRFVRFLGSGDLTNRQFNKVHNKTKKVFDILFGGKLNLVVKPDCGDGVNASSGGGWAVDKRVFICPDYFDKPTHERPAILVHELIHKLGALNIGTAGHKTSPKSQILRQVEALAVNDPKKARGNPDSYELLCQEYFHRVDAAVHRGTNNKWYVFCGNRYLRYTPGSPPKLDSKYPTTMDKNWGGLDKDFRRGIDAALFRKDNQALYFFKGNRYVRFSSGNNSVDRDYPKFLSEWKGMPSRFQEGIEAAVWRGDNGKIYFFRGNEYVRFTKVSSGMDNKYPLPISGNWGWLPGHFTSRLGAALWDDSKGRIYFFRGNEYVRSSDLKNLDAKYPLSIRNNWRRVPFGTATFDPKNAPAGAFKIRAHK